MFPAINLHRSLPLDWSILFNRLSAPVDIAFLVYFRIAFGGVVLWQVWGIFANDWVERFLTGKEFYFKYWPFYFVQPWPGDGMNIHVALLAVFAAFVMVGLLYRFSAAATFFLLTYIFLLDRALYLNHLYLTCLIAFVMIFLPAHRSLSLDALLRPGLRSTAVPAWTLWLLRFQVAVPMFFGGVAKINSDWLRGQPLFAFLQGQTDFPIIGQFFPLPPVVWLITYGALLIDLLFIFYLANRRTRVFGFIFVLAFHFINSRLFDIGIFPWLMIAATLIFFPPGWPRRMLWDIRRAHPVRVPALGLGFVLGAFIGGTLPADFSWVHIIIG
ncbi:MAG: HTTM domain-containing protein, partial [Chloroflexi bacterium]|nr:HTTM domain-containing protein [Chloroflexota bacterium]